MHAHLGCGQLIPAMYGILVEQGPLCRTHSSLLPEKKMEEQSARKPKKIKTVKT